MKWPDVKKAYPDQWLVIEALDAQSGADKKRQIYGIAVVETCEDGNTAMQSYRTWHQQNPNREYYFVHTSRESLEIGERRWLGIRGTHGS